MANLCVIPARGGSKRIPGKNIRDFLGKPIIAYSIEAAIKSGLFEEVMVSTDDEEIAQVALKYVAKLPFMRSEKNSDDFATTADVLLEVLIGYEKQGKNFDQACCLYPTAPFVSVESLHRGLDLLISEDYDTVLPIVEFSFPILRSLKMGKNGIVEPNWNEYMSYRSQDLEPAYHDVGQFYWLNVSSFMKNKQLFTRNTGGIEVSSFHAQDIDNETDWKMAELKYQIIQSNIDSE